MQHIQINRFHRLFRRSIDLSTNQTTQDYLSSPSNQIFPIYLAHESSSIVRLQQQRKKKEKKKEKVEEFSFEPTPIAFYQTFPR